MSGSNPFDPKLYTAEAISAETKGINDFIIAGMKDLPEWWDVGVQTFREQRARGEGAFPLAPKSPRAREIEIDGDTGVYRITRFTAVDDFGQILNPMLVAGQVHGGIVQGLGQAMGEHAVYDANGQLVTGSFMDYWMPRAGDFPDFNVSYNEIPSTSNALGVKGAGEAGTVGAPAAFINAMIDALRPYGIEEIDMPVTPLKLWNILQGGRKVA